MDLIFRSARKDGKLSYDETTDHWTVEITAPMYVCRNIALYQLINDNFSCSLTTEPWDVPAEEYRAKVVENTEKALTDLLFQYGEQFQKKNYTPRKPVNVSIPYTSDYFDLTDTDA